jgi:uncharacterized protein (DUF1330 family)
MTKACWIVRVSVRDEEKYPAYLAAARPAFEKFGARFIVRGGAFETMEGEARQRNVVVEFADRPTAMACYRRPEYQRAKAIRQSCAEADFIIIEGVAQDASGPAEFRGRPDAIERLQRQDRVGEFSCAALQYRPRQLQELLLHCLRIRKR